MFKDYSNTLCLIDRGLMDGKAYANEDEWQALMDDLGTNVS